MFTGLALVSAQSFNGNADKNGKMPIILVSVSGKIPNRNVLSGTVAEAAGFVPGKTFLVQVTERPSNDYGRQFNYTNLGTPATCLEIVSFQKELGAGTIFDVAATSGEGSEVTADQKDKASVVTP